MADHIVYRYVSMRYTTGYENTTAGGTVSSASTSISIAGASSGGTNRLIIAASSGAISATTFQGSTSWSSDDVDVTGEALYAWANTNVGVGGGLSIGNGYLNSAGSSGTFTSTWASATKQANISFSIVGTSPPELYDQTTGSGTDNVTCTAPIYGTDFGLFLFVQTANESVNTPTGWTLIGEIGEGTAAASGSTRITVFWADADTVSDDTPTLTIAASATELPSRPPVYPPPTRRKPNLALAVASCVLPFVAAIGDLESELSWQPEYPDRCPPKRAALNTGGAFAPAPDPIPDPPQPDFSWQPKFPDRLPRARRNPMGGMGGEGGLSAPVVPSTAYYGTSATGGGTSGTTDRTVAITPAVGDLIVCFASLSVNTNTAMTATDDQGGTYYLAGTALWGTSANIGAVFVRNSLCSSASAHTITVASGSNTAGALIAVTAKGMARAGKLAVRSFGSQADQSATTTPAPALNQSALFANMTLAAVASGDTTTSPPTNWAERQDTSQATPTTALEVATRDFGFEGTTITFGATQSTTFASFALELDGSPQPAGDWYPTFPDFARRHPPRPFGGMEQPPYDTSSPVATDIGWLPAFPDFAPRARRNPFGGPVFTFDTGGQAFSIGVATCEQKILGNPETGTWTTKGTDITVSSVDAGTDTFTATSHGMQSGDGPYRFSTTGTLPAGLSSTTDYYVDVETANTFKVSTTAANALAGTNVNVTDAGSGTLTLVRTIDTAALGSTLVAFAARGYWNLDTSAPTDNKGNTYTAAAGSPRYYATYPDSAAWVGYKVAAAGGADHTASLTYVNFDEPTVGLLEIYGVNRLQDSSHVERTGATTITSSPVTATARAVLVAFVFGSGPVGQDHTWTFLDGFTKIPGASDEGDISANGYIQVAAAYKVVNPGTYTFSAQGISAEGAQMFLLAFQANTTEEIAFDWYRQPVDPVRRVRTTRTGHVTDVVNTTPNVETNWQPEFPDLLQLRHRPRLTGGAFEPPADRSNVPYLSWAPSFPDRAPGHRPRLAGLVAWTPQDDDATPLSWSPEYPDFARGPRPRPHGGLFFPPSDELDVPRLSWAPEFPDSARGPLPRPRGGLVEALQDDDATALSWSPTYPGILRSTVRRQPGMFVLATDQVPEPPVEVTMWPPVYADRVDRETLPVASAPSYAQTLLTDYAPALAWHPTFPSQVRRAPTRPESVVVESLEAVTGAAASLTFWEPSYPTQVKRRATPIQSAPAFIELEWDRVTRYGWDPTYPDRLDRKPPTLARGFTLAVTPQDDESPLLAWHPTFVDWLPPARLSYGDYWGTFHWFLGTAEFVSVDARTPTTATVNPTRSIVSLTLSHSRVSNEGSSTLSLTATRSLASLTASESRVDNMSYEIKVGDTSPTIRATLKDQDDAAVNITGATVTFRWRLKGTSSWTTGSASIVSGSAGTVSYQFTSGQTDTAGTYESEWKVTASGNTRTFPSNEYSLFYIRS